MKKHYPDLFQNFLERSVDLTLKRLNPDPDIALSAQEKDRVINALDDALTADIAWSETWQLLDQAAPKMEMVGMRGEWVPFLERGIACASAKDDRFAEARLAIHLGEMYRHMNQLEQSDAVFQRSLKISRENSWPAEQGIALNRLAILALHRGLYVEAQNLSNSGLDLLPNDHVDRANSYYVLGISKRETGNSKDAIPLLERSCEIWKQSGSSRKHAWGLRNLGSELRLAGRFDEALQYAEQASLLSNEIGDVRSQAGMQMNIGIIKSDIGQYTDAIQMYQSAIIIFQDLDDVLSLARAYGNMGIEYRKIDASSDSERILLKSIEFAHKAQHEFTICNSMLELWCTYYMVDPQDPRTECSLNALVQRLLKLKNNINTMAMVKKFVAEVEEIMGKPLELTSP